MVWVSKKDFLENKEKYLEEMKHSVFIYPTDTIYGIGTLREDAGVNFVVPA